MATSTKVSEKMRSSSKQDVRAAGLDAPWFHPGPLIQPKKMQVQSGLVEVGQDRAAGAQPRRILSTPVRARSDEFCALPIPAWRNSPRRTPFRSRSSI